MIPARVAGVPQAARFLQNLRLAFVPGAAPGILHGREQRGVGVALRRGGFLRPHLQRPDLDTLPGAQRRQLRVTRIVVGHFAGRGFVGPPALLYLPASVGQEHVAADVQAHRCSSTTSSGKNIATKRLTISTYSRPALPCRAIDSGTGTFVGMMA